MKKTDRPVGSWRFTLPIDSAAEQPLFLQIARAVVEDVGRGRLAPGERLPGSRRLAETLGLHRNTVLAAYRELVAEGWIETSAARGTYVCRRLPEKLPRAFSPQTTTRAREPGYPLAARRLEPPLPPSHRPGALALFGGVPDVRLVPGAALARAYRRALRPDTLGYADPRGDARLRQALAAMLASARRLSVRPADLLVTRGSQMALDLVARVLLRRGDVVAVESYGYQPAWQALRNHGARLVAVPVDEQGLVVDRVAALAERRPVRAIYVTPHHQYPTTVTMSAARRLALLDLAARRRIAVIEDDYDHEFHYDGRPVLPLASSDAAGVVIYLGTLSKILAPGLRIGYVSAPPPVIDALVRERAYLDRQGDHALERALGELMEDGEVQRHAYRMRRIYRERRDAFVESLRSGLGDALDFRVPHGGMALWARAARGLDVESWAARAEARGLLLHTARRFAFDRRSRPYLRLGYAALDVAELARAAAILAASRPHRGCRRNASRQSKPGRV